MNEWIMDLEMAKILLLLIAAAILFSIGFFKSIKSIFKKKEKKG